MNFKIENYLASLSQSQQVSSQNHRILMFINEIFVYDNLKSESHWEGLSRKQTNESGNVYTFVLMMMIWTVSISFYRFDGRRFGWQPNQLIEFFNGDFFVRSVRFIEFIRMVILLLVIVNIHSNAWLWPGVHCVEGKSLYALRLKFILRFGGLVPPRHN